MPDTKPILIEITGQTDFHMGNPAAPVSVEIAIGYKKRIIPNAEPESLLYATLKSVKENGITIEDLIKACTKDNVEIPEFLQKVSFKKFYVTYGSGGIDASEFTIGFDCQITINNKLFDVAVAIKHEEKDGNASFSFGGILNVDGHQFNLQFTKNNDAWFLYASYRNQGEITIKLRELAAKFFGKEASENMPALSFTLKEFKAFLLYKKNKNNSSILFGMGAGLDLNLQDLPLAGPILSKGNAFAFKEALAIYSNSDFDINDLKGFDGLPQVSVTGGFNISAELLINENVRYYVLNEGIEKYETSSASPVVPDNETSVKPLGGTTSSKAKWKKLDKKIGPVNLQRLGFLFEEGKVVLLLDASMEMAGMGIQFMGFGLGFQLKWPPGKPDFYLDGLGLSFKVPPIEIAGAFLHSTASYENKTIDVYNGGAIIKIYRFGISAIGSYAKVGENTSLFIYGVFNGPIGGPAFFFVTGIAAGFGYNRRVNVPSIDEVALFPLVALAMKPEIDNGLLGVLAKLETPMNNGEKPIVISIGDYWLAIGIKFTSFKLVDSFVLLTVNFGTRLEFAILGLSRLSWPEKSLMPDPIVYIEMAILAHFGPDSDVISVEAVITPNSYVFSRDCRLTGGFAFYTWVKGPHEGDFVITLGGYHPRFNKPDHYPNVPRLCLCWKISNLLIIKGELYYALTASSIMAGGRWEVIFNTSIVRVTFVLWADMLIFWAPFHYYLDIGIIIKIEATIKVALIRIHFNFEMGAQLHIWGPPFAGEAYVDWTIYSFTIPFGDHSKKTPKLLEWPEFSKGFLPQKKDDPTPDPINISISNGLIDVKGEEKLPIINPQQLAIYIDSFIPVTELKVNDTILPDSTVMKSAVGDTTYNNRETGIGIRPCGFTKEEVTFKMNVTVMLANNPMDLTVTCLAKGVPEALWGSEKSESTNSNPGTSKVISNVLSGLILQPPPPPHVSQMRTFDFSKLFDESEAAFDWEFRQVKVGEAYHAYEVLGYYNDKENNKFEGILQKTYSADEVTNRRQRILSLLKEEFDNTLPEIEETEVDKMMASGNNYFKGIPVLCGIGEIPQYSTDVK